MTSNIGSPHLLEGGIEHGEINHEVREKIMSELRHQFRPEFLNRVDEIVLFKPLLLDEVTKIVALQLEELHSRLMLQGISLNVPEDAAKLIAEKSYNPVYGARPVKRYIQQVIETPLAHKIIAGELSDGDTIKLTVEQIKEWDGISTRRKL
jgi:ATP-dependent Clp protease ATP-binding subunit ClpB